LLSKRLRAWRGHPRLVSVHQTDDQASRLGNQVPVARLHLADAATELGTLLSQRGEYRDAESFLRQAVRIYESHPGPDAARLAVALSALGAACAARGRLPEAERLCRRALQIIDTGALEQP
jgi:tetratricopeptide (TPR) repeat protein